MKTDHVLLHVGEGGQVEDVLDEVWWAALAQPEEHGVAVLQQEHAGVSQPLLRAAQRSRHCLTVHLHSVHGGVGVWAGAGWLCTHSMQVCRYSICKCII